MSVVLYIRHYRMGVLRRHPVVHQEVALARVEEWVILVVGDRERMDLVEGLEEEEDHEVVDLIKGWAVLVECQVENGGGGRESLMVLQVEGVEDLEVDSAVVVVEEDTDISNQM